MESTSLGFPRGAVGLSNVRGTQPLSPLPGLRGNMDLDVGNPRKAVKWDRGKEMGGQTAGADTSV